MPSNTWRVLSHAAADKHFVVKLKNSRIEIMIWKLLGILHFVFLEIRFIAEKFLT